MAPWSARGGFKNQPETVPQKDAKLITAARPKKNPLRGCARPSRAALPLPDPPLTWYKKSSAYRPQGNVQRGRTSQALPVIRRPLQGSQRVRATSGFPLPTLPPGHSKSEKLVPEGGRRGGYKTPRPPGAPRSPARGCRHPIYLIQMPQEASKMPSDAFRKPQEAFKKRFCRILGRTLMPICVQIRTKNEFLLGFGSKEQKPTKR